MLSISESHLSIKSTVAQTKANLQAYFSVFFGHTVFSKHAYYLPFELKKKKKTCSFLIALLSVQRVIICFVPQGRKAAVMNSHQLVFIVAKNTITP